MSRGIAARAIALSIFFAITKSANRYWFEAAQSAIQRMVNVSLILCEVGDLEIVDTKLKR